MVGCQLSCSNLTFLSFCVVFFHGLPLPFVFLVYMVLCGVELSRFARLVSCSRALRESARYSVYPNVIHGDSDYWFSTTVNHKWLLFYFADGAMLADSLHFEWRKYNKLVQWLVL